MVTACTTANENYLTNTYIYIHDVPRAPPPAPFSLTCCGVCGSQPYVVDISTGDTQPNRVSLVLQLVLTRFRAPPMVRGRSSERTPPLWWGSLFVGMDSMLAWPHITSFLIKQWESVVADPMPAQPEEAVAPVGAKP